MTDFDMADVEVTDFDGLRRANCERDRHGLLLLGWARGGFGRLAG